MNKVLLFLPILVFGVIAIFSVRSLSLDQTKLPSQMIDKPVPKFDLVKLPDIPPLENKHLKGQVTLVNIFGSWCSACRIEHPFLMKLQREGTIPIYGIDWADTPERGAAWLERFGNSYDRVGNDEQGRTVIDFGVTGAPETFIVDAEGRIRYRHVGPITANTWKKTLEPLVRELQQQAASDSN